MVRRNRPVSLGASATEEEAMFPSRKSAKPSPENWPLNVYELLSRVPRKASARLRRTSAPAFKLCLPRDHVIPSYHWKLLTVKNHGCCSESPVNNVLLKDRPSGNPALLPSFGANGTPAFAAIGLPEFCPRCRWICRP